MSMLDNFLSIRDEEISIISEEKKIVVDSKVYVSYVKFLEVRFGITTITGLTGHDEMATIISTMGACVDINNRLHHEGLLSDNVDDKVVEDIKQSKGYIEYTNESGTIFLTLEKLFQVCKRIFLDFKLLKKDYAVMASFRHETKDLQIMDINTLITYVMEIYHTKNKKILLEKESRSYNQILFHYMKKRYPNEQCPRSLNDLSIGWLKNVEPFDIAELTNTLNINRLVNALVDDNNDKVEPKVGEPGFIRSKCQMLTSNVHEPDRIVSYQTAKVPELESFVSAMIKLGITTENSRSLINKYLSEVNDIPDSTLKITSLEHDFSVFNTSWITAPKDPKTEVQRVAVEAARSYMKLFSTEPHILIYCNLTHECYKVKHKYGMLFKEQKYITQFMRVLPKLFHYIVYLGTFFSKDKSKLESHVGAVIGLVASQFSGNVPAVHRVIGYVLSVNVKIWCREVEIHDFPDIKESYLPSSVVGMTMEVNEEGVDEIPQLFVM